MLQRRESILQRHLPGPGDHDRGGSREHHQHRLASLHLFLLPRRHLHGRHDGGDMTPVPGTVSSPPQRQITRRIFPPSAKGIGDPRRSITGALTSPSSSVCCVLIQRLKKKVVQKKKRCSAHGGSLSLVLETCRDLGFLERVRSPCPPLAL